VGHFASGQLLRQSSIYRITSASQLRLVLEYSVDEVTGVMADYCNLSKAHRSYWGQITVKLPGVTYTNVAP